MSKNERPIKVIRVSVDDFQDKNYGFGEKEPIRQVTPALKNRLSSEVKSVAEYFQASFKRWPGIPAVAKVTLHEKALAKSHRPTSLLGDKTCPVIGSCNLGELLVSVTAEGLERLEKKIVNSTKTKNGTLHIATIDKIEPYEHPNDCDLDMIKQSDYYILRLFDHKNRNTNRLVDKLLKEFAEELNIEEIVKHSISSDVSFYEVKSSKNIYKLSDFIGVRKLQPMPEFTLEQNITLKKAKLKSSIGMFPPPEPDKHYPLVGIIDGGVDPNNLDIEPWVWDRLDLIQSGDDHDYSHGNSVAGLIINGFNLNNKIEGFPKTQAEIVDVVAFPANRGLKLTELMSIIRKSVSTYPEVKIWNLSLGGESPCEDDSFSELGHFLSDLHDEYGCLFIIASGNYIDDPQRTWPPQELKGKDRISSPGDSVRALTVGSIAHRESVDSVVKAKEPSSFSRCGPGPAYTPKPEVTHFGGNCRSDLSCDDVGVVSFDENGNLAEIIGTSFSTPLVSSIAASVWHEIELNGTVAPTPERVKALLIHSAMLSNRNVPSASELKYHGFGKPSDNVIDLLTCSQNEVTFMFEVDTREGVEFGRTPFVIPKSLRTSDGKFSGEILMTLVYSPLLDFDFPSEYCRTNVDVSFGTYDKGNDGKPVHSGKVPQVKDKSELYEKTLVQNGFKWSSVKVYRKKFPQGIKGDNWRLKLEVQRRAEQEPLENPQRAVLIITLKSLKDSAGIYSEAISEMTRLGWSSADIIVEQQPEVRVR